MKTDANWSYAKYKKEFNQKHEIFEDLKRVEYHDSETCENCNSPIDLELHHIIPLRIQGRNTITNFRRLCKNCHAKVHWLVKGEVTLKTEDNPFFGFQLQVLFDEFLHENCDNCSSSKGLSMRLVVPFEQGGQHVKGNFTTLCSDCNSLLELNTDENGILNHSFLIKKGQEQARKEGKILGRPDLSKTAKNAMVDHFLNNKSIKELAIDHKISETALYRYKKRFNELYIFVKKSSTEFTLIDKNTKVEKYSYNVVNRLF